MSLDEDTGPALCLSLDNLNWLYRGEGNANLVISLPQEKIILRMQKCEYDCTVNRRLIQKCETKIIRDLKFHNLIMLPLIGKEFVQAPLLAKIPENDVSELDSKLYKYRPSFRLNKGIRFSLMTIHPDYTHFPQSSSYEYFRSGLPFPNSISMHNENPIYCIEIKPKQGWIPICDRNHPKCTFCCNQYLKYVKKRVMKISKYCPLDLFSGNRTRMKKAIKNLLKTPQNNLKIFKNGNVVYSDDCLNDCTKIIGEILEPGNQKVDSERLIEKWSALLQEALTKQLTEEPLFSILPDGKDFTDYELNSNINIASPLEGLVSPCDWSNEPLPENCVLQRILMVQKLQKTGFNRIYKTFCDKKNSESDYYYVEDLLSTKKCLNPIGRYLLSATAKDCSIFIAFQRCSNKNVDTNLHHVTDFDGVNYRMNIGISDLDPKPLSCIEKHHRRDDEILTAILCYKSINEINSQ